MRISWLKRIRQFTIPTDLHFIISIGKIRLYLYQAECHIKIQKFAHSCIRAFVHSCINIKVMSYTSDYQELKRRINFRDDVIPLGTEDLHNFTFISKSHGLLPGHEHYRCAEHGLDFNHPDGFLTETWQEEELLHIADPEVKENNAFRYHIMRPAGGKKISEMVMLFHGFNEKTWDKYLPWAQKIVRETGKAVVLFPIAFHMNRAPVLWNDKRTMYAYSERRKEIFPDIIKSSLSNVAISVRLHAMPQRFIWSGLQTYNDVISFVEMCRNGLHPAIEKEFTVDFFTYSIGSLLAEILKLTNYKGYFTDTRLCMFCGGAVFNRLSPVSKFILDSEANVALYSYLVEHIESHRKKDPRLNHFMSPAHPEGYNFYCMLDYKAEMDYRENRFREISSQVLAVTLKQDKVVPAYEVINTLQGAGRDLPIPVEIFDLPYSYQHEDPFPASGGNTALVDEAFDQIFEPIVRFLR